MKRLTIFAILILCAAAFAVPQYLTYQGVLRDSSGTLVTGTKSMAFSIYDNATAGTQVYSQAAANISVSNGNYTVQLGPITTPTTVFSGGERWLKVTVDGTDLSPRLKINSVAYAMRAENADVATSANSATTATTATTVNDGSISTQKISNEAVTAAKIASGTITGTQISSPITLGNVTATKITVTEIATMGAGCVGIASLLDTQTSATVSNSNATTNSIILLTPLKNGGLLAKNWLKVKTRNTDSFVVTNSDESDPTQDVTFMYLIIN